MGIWWPCLQPMQVLPSGGQIWNKCKWRHLVVKFGINMQVVHPVAKLATNASGAIWWSNLESICKWCIRWQNWQPMQVAPSGGQIWNQYASGASGGKIGNQCKWRHLVAKLQPIEEVSLKSISNYSS